MLEFFARVVINAVAIAITATLLPGIVVLNNDLGTLLLIGLVFGVVNAIIKPILIFMTCPAVLLSLGLFILVINGCMLMLTASIVGQSLTVDGWGWAILGGIIMSILSMILEGMLGLRDRDDGNGGGGVKVEYHKS